MAIQPWELQPEESDPAYQAWEMYLSLGDERSVRKTAEVLGKSPSLIGEWSSRHRWVERIRAWNRHNSNALFAKLRAGNAEMRERLAIQGRNMQGQAAKRIVKMTDAEINALSPRELIAMSVAGAKLETMARTVSDSDLDQVTVFDVPNFEIVFMESRPDEMVPARMADGTTGYLPKDQVAAFVAEYPDAVVIQ